MGRRGGRELACRERADPLIQRFTTESPTLDATQVLAAITRMRQAGDEEGFLVCDAVTGQRLGNIVLQHDGRTG